MKKKELTQDNPGDSRELTADDHKKIQRLLKTTDVDNVRLAIGLIEETCDEVDRDAIFTDDVILALGDPGEVELFAIASSFFLRHKEHWDRFIQVATSTRVLTGAVVRYRSANLWDFTAITVEAATLLVKEWGRLDLNGLSTISLEVVQQLATQASAFGVVPGTQGRAPMQPVNHN